VSVSIETVRPAAPEEWDEVWRSCDYATYFHSREWAEIWRDYTKGKMTPEPLMVSFSDGKRALLPLSSQKRLRGLVKSYVSSPAGTFGGWISTDQLDTAHGAALADYMITHFANLTWRLNPYDNVVSQVDVSVTEEDETHCLRLGSGFEDIYARWSDSHRRAVLKARKEGVEVIKATDRDDWLAYYDVYKDSLRRWGDHVSSMYQWEIFEEVHSRGPEEVVLWIARYRGKAIAGVLCMYAKKHVAYWHGATLEKYFPMRPMHLVMYAAIMDACERGYAWFDFNPSGEHEGVKTFKKRFGAEALAAPVICTKSKPMCLIDGIVDFIR